MGAPCGENGCTGVACGKEVDTGAPCGIREGVWRTDVHGCSLWERSLRILPPLFFCFCLLFCQGSRIWTTCEAASILCYGGWHTNHTLYIYVSFNNFFFSSTGFTQLGYVKQTSFVHVTSTAWN